MSAKQKALLSIASSVFKTPSNVGSSFVNTIKRAGATSLEVFKRPFVAPAVVGVTFIAALSAFVFLAGDPNAGSPSVRVSLAHVKDQKHSVAVNDTNISGKQAFSLDSLGLFQDDTTLNVVSPNAGVTITIPDAAKNATAQVEKLAAKPLVSSPISALIQTTPDGPIPIMAAGGLSSASAYARPFKSDGRPFVALIVGGLGLNPVTTKAAIEQLPAEVTLSFVPYSQGLQGWIDMARAQGHEVMIEVPMQPINYPDNDPGPQTLMANARPEDLTARLNWVLTRATGYFAVSNYQGSAFFKDKVGLTNFMSVLQTRGIAFIDDGSAHALKGAWGRASAERIIDAQITSASISTQLTQLEQSARTHGKALGTGFAYPVTLTTAIRWTQGLSNRGIQLAPASAIVHR